ncbi:hypothetical protein [Thermoleptolyngbya oregonensis]|uniref:hypothetical protein n=1 Tax=Thermoleptolyngbya oregonensis TaxID=2303529 RepID=UPI00292D8E48|nr:hypothetical protein [Thermoleptolyngbya oregonensis]
MPTDHQHVPKHALHCPSVAIAPCPSSENRFPQSFPLAPFTRCAARVASLTVGLLPLWLAIALPAQATVSASVGESVEFSCQDSESVVRQKGGPVVTIGRSRIYIGYRQVSANNKNPIVVRFNRGQRAWCRADYEITADDGEGYGLLWDGSSALYAVFSATGTQGTASQDYRRFTRQGWLTSYGSGGGPKVAVLARLNPTNGAPTAGTFLTAQLSSGRSNSLEVTGLSWTGSRLVVTANSWFSPRRANRQPMSCSGSSPFFYRVVFSGDLRQVFRAQSDRCS